MNNDKTKSILSYIIFICAIIFLFQKDSSRDVKLHAAQSIVNFVIFIILSFVFVIIFGVIEGLTGIGLFSIFARLPYILYFICMILGIVKANSAGDQEIPVIGGIAKSIFGKQIEG